MLLSKNYKINELIDKNDSQKQKIQILNKKVYVGNISYTATEAQIIEVLSIVGPVVSFKFNINKETGQQKGFGFCEYQDYESASSAIRNLNGYEFQGRSIKIHFPDKAEDIQKMDMQNMKPQNEFDIVKFENINKDKQLSEVLVSLEPKQKYFIMLELKNLIDQDSVGFCNHLAKNQKFCQAILQMQIDLRMENQQQNQQRNVQQQQLTKKIKKISKDQRQIRSKQQIMKQIPMQSKQLLGPPQQQMQQPLQVTQQMQQLQSSMGYPQQNQQIQQQKYQMINIQK